MPGSGATSRALFRSRATGIQFFFSRLCFYHILVLYSFLFRFFLGIMRWVYYLVPLFSYCSLVAKGGQPNIFILNITSCHNYWWE